MLSHHISGQLAIDANSLTELKSAAKQRSPETIQKVAAQFEAMFVNMMLKSMRDATMQSGLMDNEQTKTYTSMFDQQLSQHIASKGVGLAEVLSRQLNKQSIPADSLSLPLQPALPAASNPTSPALSFNKSSAAPSNPAPAISNGNPPAHVSQFKATLTKHAEQVSAASGIPASFLLGQAALETGWGKHAPIGADGTHSFNLFGIKAGNHWTGKVVEAQTTEYINGVKQQRIERFRAYDSYAESFADFAHLMQSAPRYRNVMANLDNIERYAGAIQRAGYATDPHYADKLVSVVNRLSV